MRAISMQQRVRFYIEGKTIYIQVSFQAAPEVEKILYPRKHLKKFVKNTISQSFLDWNVQKLKDGKSITIC